MDPDGSPDPVALVVLIALAAAIYLLAALVEGAVSSLSRARIQRLNEQDARAARSIVDFAEHPNGYLTSAAIIKLTALLAVAILVFQLIDRIALSANSLLAWILLLVGTLVLGWILPRAVGGRWPEGVTLSLGPPFRVVAWIFNPLVQVARVATAALARLLGATALPEGPVVTSDELKEMVAASEEEGLIEQGERTMIDNILELEEISVREIMVPRPDMVAILETTTVREAVDTFIQEGYSRLPVFRETIDDIVGVLYGKDLFPLVLDGKLSEPVGGFARPAYFVPESKKSDDLLRELQQKRIQIAIVVDEYGGTAGLVTIEDLLEEIVGEIQDEFDVEEQKIVVEGDDQALVAGTVSIDDVNDALALHLEAEEVDTIGGLIYEKLGRVPVIGDQVRADGALLRVVAADGRRVSRVLVKRADDESPEAALSVNPPAEGS